MADMAIRAGAAAAIAGGTLRIADTFTGGVLPPAVLDALYLVTDVLLLGGAAALWASQRTRLGVPGWIGVTVFMLGIALIRAAPLGFGSYQTGATVALSGL